MHRRFAVMALVALAVGLAATPAIGQVTTSGIRGLVVDATGPLPGAQVLAVNVASGFQYGAVADVDGSFKLSGLVPGTYEVKVSSQAYTEQSVRVQVLLGQDAQVSFTLSPTEVFVGDVTVVGETTKLLIDTRSPVVSTNVTTQQIEALPQNNRNFLSFAALAPGVAFTDDTNAAGQGFRSGGANPKQVNVFIDGMSFKNDIIKGGAFMQDSSRGNPFPQNAVQEYQVLTQNYKAEYEKSAAAVITAITKSGGNEFHGEVFWLFQNDGMVEQDDFAEARGDEEPSYDRNQYGLAFGGPIVQDKLHFFLSWERNDRENVSSVYHGSSWDIAPDNVIAILDDYPTGTLPAPLLSDLFFGKVTWQPGASQTMDLSYHMRDEDETRDFGNQNVEQAGTNIVITTDALTLRHQAVFNDSTLNEASLTWQELGWATRATNPGTPRQEYANLLNIGSMVFPQELTQDRIGVREDISFYFDGWGSHTLKAGAVASWLDYSLNKSAFQDPAYYYREDEDWQFPYRASYGFGDPAISFSNEQYGLFVQDDWRITSNFTLNFGLRWDYETNMLNNDWVTPADVVSGLENSCRTYDPPIGGQADWCIDELFDPANYISTGDNRSSYSDMYQPRLGFTWDIGGNATTVLYGGWGLYYDRVTLNDIYDEQSRHSWKQYSFCFTMDGTQPEGCSVPAIMWDPSYLTEEGLAGLIASGQTPGPEVYLLANDTKPPRTTQWAVGLRQQMGDWLGSLSYASVEGDNGLAWSFGTLPPGTAFNDRWGSWVGIPNYGFIVRGFDVRQTEYDAVYLTLDRPYTRDAKWGLNFVYTYAEAWQDASLDEGTAFAFDFLPPDFPKFPGNADERHRFVASGTVGLPLNLQLSSIITLGSGVPFTYTDCLAGFDQCVWHPNGGRPEKQSFLGINEFVYRSVDLRLQWDAPFGNTMNLALIGEGFNILDFANDSCFDGWAGAPGEPNPNFGQPTCQYNARRWQVGARFSF
jgi:outer membrane receptor for ferrienterochelin and colicin